MIQHSKKTHYLVTLVPAEIMNSTIVLLATLVCAVCCLPLVDENELPENLFGHKMTRRFINPSLTIGDYSSNLIDKMRSRRSVEECEKLQLCKLHARSQRNFIAAFELYFVNKENARLWDHQTHTMGDCYRRYSCYR